MGAEELMPEPTDPPAKPLRTWRPMILWSAGIVLALGLAWFIGAVVVPVWRTSRVLAAHTDTGGELRVDDEEAFVRQLGGQANLISLMELYTRMPTIIAGDRYLAAWSLGCGGEDALPAIRRALKRAGPDVRAGALHAAAMLVYRTRNSEHLALLLDALDDRDGGVRFESGKLLARLCKAAPELGVEAELEKHLGDTDFRPRNAAAAGLWRAAGKGAKPLGLLLAALEDSDPAVRKDAVMALADLGTEVARPALERAMGDADPEVRKAIRWARSRCVGVHLFIDDDEEVDRAFASLRDLDWEVRARTALLLEEANSWFHTDSVDDAVVVLQQALRDENRCVRDCAAYALRSFTPEQLAPRGPLVIEMFYDEKSLAVEYSVGGRSWVVGEEALREAVARKVRRRGYLAVRLAPFAEVAPIFQRELDAAKAACETADARVGELPELLSKDLVILLRTEARSAELTLRIVGVRDGVLQFRLDDRFAEGQDALLRVLSQRIGEVEKEKGGPTAISVAIKDAPELKVLDAQWKAIRLALEEAEPYLTDGWYMSGVFGKRRTVPGPDGKPIPADLPVEVRILGPGDGGNRYQIDGRTFEGEAAFSVELKRRLAEFRSGKDGPGRFALSVRLRVEVGPGVTVTEEQLTLARKTVADSAVCVPEKTGDEK
jgi:HEAT repeat protein